MSRRPLPQPNLLPTRIVNIHPTAIIHPHASLDQDVVIGPYAVVGERVRVAKGSRIGAHVVIEGETEIGEACTVFPFASIGTAPQDLKYKGEPTRLTIGRGNTFREYVTLHRGTAQGGGQTRIGDDNLLMAYAHVAHDCVLGNQIVMANAATLGGHVRLGDHAILGGLVGVHQFVHIGAYAIVGGGAIVVQDVPPYVRVAGNHAKLYGLNLIGLKRHDFSMAQIAALKGAYKLLFRSGLTVREGAQRIRAQWGDQEAVESLVRFVEQSERGSCR